MKHLSLYIILFLIAGLGYISVSAQEVIDAPVVEKVAPVERISNKFIQDLIATSSVSYDKAIDYNFNKANTDRIVEKLDIIIRILSSK